jgi:hypothetical protein
LDFLLFSCICKALYYLIMMFFSSVACDCQLENYQLYMHCDARVTFRRVGTWSREHESFMLSSRRL